MCFSDIYLIIYYVMLKMISHAVIVHMIIITVKFKYIFLNFLIISEILIIYCPRFGTNNFKKISLTSHIKLIKFMNNFVIVLYFIYLNLFII